MLPLKNGLQACQSGELVCEELVCEELVCGELVCGELFCDLMDSNSKQFLETLNATFTILNS